MSHDQDRHRRRRHRVRARPLRHGAGRRRPQGAVASRARPSCWRTSATTWRRSTCWSSTCGCRTPAASSWCARIRKIDGGRLPILVFSGTIASAEEVRDLAALGVAGYVNEYSAVQHILPSLAPHLFPDNFNRRGSPRVVLGIPVAYRFGNTIAAALTLNLSKGGVAIRTMSPLDQAREGPRPVPPARIEGGHRGRLTRRLERPPRRHGPAVREGRARPTRPRSTSSSTSISSRNRKA